MFMNCSFFVFWSNFLEECLCFCFRTSLDSSRIESGELRGSFDSFDWTNWLSFELNLDALDTVLWSGDGSIFSEPPQTYFGMFSKAVKNESSVIEFFFESILLYLGVSLDFL